MASRSVGVESVLRDRYVLRELIGRGGMADVFRAEDRTLDRAVAVKVMRDLAGDEGDRARFVAEARTLAGLSHSGLVTLLDAGLGRSDEESLPGHMYLVMELVEGPTVAEVLSRGPVRSDQAGAWGVQLAEALAYVHQHGVVHRDVKPANILLGDDGRVRLADFGISRLVDDATRHTRTGQTIGTAAYLSPEQVTGGEVTGASDVYSLGLVLLEALTGRQEYPGPATQSALARVNRRPEVPQDLPGCWHRLLRDMTTIEPQLRPLPGEVAQVLRGQTSEPVPLLVAGTADPAVAPILGRAESEADNGAARTRLLSGDEASTVRLSTPGPGSSTVAAPSEPMNTPWVDRAGDRLAQEARRLVDRARRLETDQRVLVAIVAALMLFVLVIGVLGGGAGTSELPSNTPDQLRQPLQQLHDAVEGDR